MTKLEVVRAYMKYRGISIDEFACAINRKPAYWRRVLYKNVPFNDKLEFAIRAAYPDLILNADSNKLTVNDSARRES
jgi:hypothetical protein